MHKSGKIYKPILSVFIGAVVLLTSCEASLILAEPDDNSGYVYYNGAEITGMPYILPPVPQTHTSAATTTAAATKKPAKTTTAQTKAESSKQTAPAAQEKPQTTSAPKTTEAKTTKKPQTSTSAETKAPQPAAPAPVPNDELPVNTYSALNYKTVKGMWISYFELYPILTGKDPSSFRKGIGNYYDNAVSLGINTVFVHVRPYGDAIYESEYFPWSKYCTGYIGEDPGYDPLDIMIDEAHKRGLSFHAWINPLRCYQQDDAPQVPDGYLTKQWYDHNDGDYIVKVNDYWYLNPAYKEVRELIALGVSEIVSGYDVDGVHIDDYFYPTTEEWFDSTAYYNSSYTDLSEFRLDNCSKMTAAMYSAVKSHNSTALFGISTQGNIANNIYTLYADVERWCTQPGYADYMAPQIYYGFENSAQPFETVVEQWDEMLSGTGKKLIPGLAVYKIGAEDTWAGDGAYEWINDTNIIKRQIQFSSTAASYGGVILYSYQFIFSPESSVAAAVQKEIDAVRPLFA